MGHRHALGPARRPTRVDHVGRLIVPDRNVERSASIKIRPPRWGCDLERRTVAAEAAVVQDQCCPDLVDQHVEAIARLGAVERQVGGTRTNDRDHRDDQVHRAWQNQRHHILGGYPGLRESAREQP